MPSPKTLPKLHNRVNKTSDLNTVYQFRKRLALNIEVAKSKILEKISDCMGNTSTTNLCHQTSHFQPSGYSAFKNNW